MHPQILKSIEFVKKYQVQLLIGGLVITTSTSFYYQSKYYDLQENPQKAVQTETDNMINKISKLIVLPDNEKPTIATVSNPEQLKDQPFFAKAQKGFKVLIYANAGKSILYDPFENKIIETASMNINSQAVAPPSPSPVPKKK